MRVAALITLAIVAYWPTCTGLWHYWSDDIGYGGHGLLVAGLVLWLLWRVRRRVVAAPVQSRPLALVPLLTCSIAAATFWRAGIEQLQFLMLPALVFVGAWAAFGWAVTRAIAVPIGFLYFAMPTWNLLAAPLQSLTIRIVRLLAPLIGVPAAISGSWISLPDGLSFNVTLTCSGIGFLVQGLAVAALVGELEQASVSRRLQLLAGMAVVAVVTNWIRVLTIIHVGYSTGMRHVLVTRHHVMFGYLLFVLVLVAFTWVARRTAPGSALPAVAVAPVQSCAPAPAGYLRALIALAAVPLLVGILALLHEGEASARQMRLPSGRGNWSGPITTNDPTWRPVFVGPHGEWRGTYRDLDGHSVEVLAIGYGTQAQGRELVSESNSPLGSGGLSPLTGMIVTVAGEHYRQDLVVDERGERSVIWSFYAIGGRPLVGPLQEQLWYGVSALASSPYSAWVALKTACIPSCAEVVGRLGDFARVMRPGLLAAAMGSRPVSGSSGSAESP